MGGDGAAQGSGWSAQALHSSWEAGIGFQEAISDSARKPAEVKTF